MDNPQTTVENKRRAPRKRVLKAAKIIFDDWRAMDCQIRDVSETGALLRIAGAPTLPSEFKLLQVTENTIRPVRVAWKQKETLGVTFTGEATKAPVRKFVTGMC